MIWDLWKQGFSAWEQATAQYFEKLLTNPAVLGPAGAMLTAAMKTKTATDRALASWWASDRAAVAPGAVPRRADPLRRAPA